MAEEEKLPEVKLLEAAGVYWEAVNVNQYSTEVEHLGKQAAVISFRGSMLVRDPEALEKIRELWPEYEAHREAAQAAKT